MPKKKIIVGVRGCDGCKKHGANELRADETVNVPIIGGRSGNHLILCQVCFNKEMKHRNSVNERHGRKLRVYSWNYLKDAQDRESLRSR